MRFTTLCDVTLFVQFVFPGTFWTILAVHVYEVWYAYTLCKRLGLTTAAKWMPAVFVVRLHSSPCVICLRDSLTPRALLSNTVLHAHGV